MAYDQTANYADETNKRKMASSKKFTLLVSLSYFF